MNTSLGADSNNVRESLQKLVKNANHIKKWYFNKVRIDGKPSQLPNNIRIVECRHSDCVSFKNIAFEKLKKLVLEGVKFQKETFEFPDLKVFKVTRYLLGDSLKEKKVLCPRLQVLQLNNVYHYMIPCDSYIVIR